MKALSIRQPWASLILEGQKTLEIRTWKTPFRGKFVLCAALAVKKDRGGDRYLRHDMPKGVTLAICELLDVRPAVPKDAEKACVVPLPGEFAWEIRVIEKIEPTLVKGRLGFWTFN